MALLVEQTSTDGSESYTYGLWSTGQGARQGLILDIGSEVTSIQVYVRRWPTKTGSSLTISLREGPSAATVLDYIAGVNTSTWSDAVPDWKTFNLTGVTTSAFVWIQFDVTATDTVVNWQADSTNPYNGGIMSGWRSGGTIPSTWDAAFRVYGNPPGPSLSKPTTPSPANASGPGIDFSNFTFGWVNGGGATNYDVYLGSSALALNFFTNVSTESYTPAPASAARSFILAVQSIIYWRVNARDNAENVVTGDVWSFDPRPGKASNPSPEDDATGRGLNIPLSWDAGDYADTYDVYLDTGPANDLIAQAISETTTTAHVPLDHSTTYAWRVDSENQFGVTEGDVWSFTTYSYDPPLPTWTNLPGKSLGPLDGGTAGVDFYYTGENFMMAVRSLVVAAGDAIWYEVPDA